LNYKAGELLAVGYQTGSGVSRSVLKTTGVPAAIRLTPERNSLKAECGDLFYIMVELIDAQGSIVYNTDNNIYFTACGVSTLLAVGNSNPVSEKMYTGNQRKVHEGRVMVVVRANGDSEETYYYNCKKDKRPTVKSVSRVESALPLGTGKGKMIIEPLFDSIIRAKKTLCEDFSKRQSSEAVSWTESCRWPHTEKKRNNIVDRENSEGVLTIGKR
jgi:hypothetical protein